MDFLFKNQTQVFTIKIRKNNNQWEELAITTLHQKLEEYVLI